MVEPTNKHTSSVFEFIIILCCSFSSDIEISKQQMPKKIAEVAKEATILDYEVTRIEHGTKPLNKQNTCQILFQAYKLVTFI